MNEIPGGSKPRVLVTDDDPDVLDVTCELLDWEFTPVRAASCGEALALMRKAPVDVAVLDYNLPDGNGYSLLAGLIASNPRVKAVFLSGTIPPPIGPVWMESRVVRFLAKPAKISTLVSAVKEALTAARQV